MFWDGTNLELLHRQFMRPLTKATLVDNGEEGANESEEQCAR